MKAKKITIGFIVIYNYLIVSLVFLFLESTAIWVLDRMLQVITSALIALVNSILPSMVILSSCESQDQSKI